MAPPPLPFGLRFGLARLKPPPGPGFPPRLHPFQSLDHRPMKGRKDTRSHALANLHPQRGRKRRFHLITPRAHEVLQVGVLLDLGTRLLIRSTQLVLDDHRPDDQAGILGGASLLDGQTLVIPLGQLIPG